MNLKPILVHILEHYSLPLAGCHGVGHWARVLENGMKLAETTGANTDVVSLFAIFHDSQRFNESSDPEHGPRAAAFADSLRGTLIWLPDATFELLLVACRDHTHERTHCDVTVQTCWDADRLDLGRVGVTPVPSRLCTNTAKSSQMLQWANARARNWLIPELVASDWGIQL